MNEQSNIARRNTQLGVALISMLLVLAVVTALCAQMLMKNRLELKRSEALIRMAQAEQMVFSGLAYGEVLVLELAEMDGAASAEKRGRSSAEKAIAWDVEKTSAQLQVRGASPAPLIETEAEGESPIRPYWPFAEAADDFYLLVEDEQSKFNLNGLVDSEGRLNQTQLRVFQRLLLSLELDVEIALYIADWIDRDRVPEAYDSEDFAYLRQPIAYRTANRPIEHWKEVIAVKGVEQKTLGVLSRYVTAIPGASAINVNTASATLLEAMIPGLDGEAVVEKREAGGGFTSVAEFSKSTATAGLKMDAGLFTVSSHFYTVTAYCLFDGFESGWQTLLEYAQVKKKNAKPEIYVLWKRKLPFWELGSAKNEKFVGIENE